MEKIMATLVQQYKALLRNRGLSVTEANGIASKIAAFHNLGFDRPRIMPNGIPAMDAIEVSGVVDSEAEIKAIITEANKNPISIRKIEIFPYGIVAPDRFRVEIGMSIKP
jgi:hypothetical protein